MKEYMPNPNRLADSAKLAGGKCKLIDGLLIHKNNPIHICSSKNFASTTKLFKKVIKNIKQHFKKCLRSSVSPTNQDLSNDTTFSQIQSRVPVPLR